jgi:disulfide bond formation protein DsbB
MDRLSALTRQYFPWLYRLFPARILVAFAVALVSILGALGSQFLLGMEPCELCYWQRWPFYFGVPLLALLVLLWKQIPASLRIGLTVLAALIFVVSIGLASYHAGIEYKLWPGPATCTGLGDQLNFADLNNLETAERIVPCDVVPFEIFGISMAGFNALGSTFITFMLGWSALGQWQRFKAIR